MEEIQYKRMNNLLFRIKDQLEKDGIKFELISLPEDLSIDVVSHMKFHGKPLKYAMPNIVLKTEKGFFVVQRRGDTQIDNKKLKKLLDVQRLSLANKEDLEKFGLEPGIVPPLGYDIPTFIDKKALENEEIYTGTGDKLFALKLNPQDLIKVNKATVGDFTKDESSQEGGRVLSGIRATGQLHLGNYLGAVKGMLELQENPDYETFYMVVDLHTLTTPYDKESLSSSVRNIIIDYLACGLDPQKSTLFIQSMVPEHLELAYLFSTVVSVARMQHLPTFKEKVKQYPENVTMALLNYPVLMAADILAYKADLVPVGIDQEPHLEVAREIARKMNEKYSLDLPEPERFATSGEYIPSLTGEGKMSKSVEGSYINLNDDLETIKKKIRAVPTSSVVGGEKTGGVSTLFTLLKAFSKEKYDEFDKKYSDGILKYVELKDYLAEAIYNNLKPIQEKRRKLEQDREYVDQVIKEGAAKARKVASETLKEVKEAMGIDYP